MGDMSSAFECTSFGMIARNRISLTTLASSAIETLSAEMAKRSFFSRADMDTPKLWRLTRAFRLMPSEYARLMGVDRWSPQALRVKHCLPP